MRSAFRRLLLVSVLAAACTDNGPRIAEGANVPALSADAHDGTTVNLAELGGKPTLIYFYPKDGTPGCTKEACAFRDAWKKYDDAGVQIIGVSSDSNESHAKFAKEHDLQFPLIADEDGSWAKAFGVGATLGMAARDSFLIGPDGTIAKVYPGADPAVHAEEVLRDAKALLPSG